MLFITGTDTGVGKTVLTALLLAYARRKGIRALAVKPFTAGGKGDVRLLQSLQPGELTDAEMNPHAYAAPLAPWMAARGRGVTLDGIATSLRALRRRCDLLLVEGAGGLLSPLGERYTFADVRQRLDGRILVVAPNRLGVLNHVLLTLHRLGKTSAGLVLMGQAKPDAAAISNARAVRRWTALTPTWELPWMGRGIKKKREILRTEKKMRKTLANILGRY